MRVGLLGLGRIGAPVCANLVRAGHRLSAFDVRTEVSSAALDTGASWEDSARAVATGAEVLVTVLPGPAEVAAALDEAVFAALSPDAVWIDMTSNTPLAAAPLTDRARAHGVEVLEAPLGGGPDDARQARLRLFVGGEREVLARCRPLLEAVAPADRIVHVGGHGAGYTTKLLVNALWFGQAAATAEALLLGHRAGIDPAVLRDALAGSAAASDFIRRDLPALFTGDYLRSYPLDRIHDQLAAVAEAASDLGTHTRLRQHRPSRRRIHECPVSRGCPAGHGRPAGALPAGRSTGLGFAMSRAGATRPDAHGASGRGQWPVYSAGPDRKVPLRTSRRCRRSRSDRRAKPSRSCRRRGGRCGRTR